MPMNVMLRVSLFMIYSYTNDRENGRQDRRLTILFSLPVNRLQVLRCGGDRDVHLQDVLADGAEDRLDGEGRKVAVHNHAVFV